MDRLAAALADRYTIERELGQGGMATVYLAHDIKHDRKVAVKVLRPELAAVIGAERFLAEIKTTANLQHPHILPLFDSGEADSFLFYVMPYVAGISLRDRMTREKQLPINDAVRIASEVAAALDYAHRHGVIHRDIKPENIMLHDGSALIADFGIALAASKSGGTRMTETGVSHGTPHYMSPEQAMGERDLDARTDVYALGCVTYEMLTGEPPFSGPSAQAIVAKAMTEKPTSIMTRRERVPEHVEDAVLTALEKLPADRFASAAEFATALAGGTVPRRKRRSASRWPRSAVTTAATALLALPVIFALGRRSGASSANESAEWEAQQLGGSLTALTPSVSPDGQSVAFAAMINGTTELAILKPATGDWAVLTHDTTGGTAGEFSWSPDGSRIYFSRYFEVPRGVFSIAAVGGDVRTVLENAGSPDALPDGSLLVARLNADRLVQMFRLSPETGRLDTFPAFSGLAIGQPFFRAFVDGSEAAFFGTTTGDSGAKPHLYVIDLATKRARQVGASLDLSGVDVSQSSFGMSRDGRSILIDLPRGDLQRIMAIPRDGSNAIRTLVTFTSDAPYLVSGGPDGAVYADLVTRPNELVSFDPATRKIERVPAPASGRRASHQILPIGGNRALVTTTTGGRARVMISSPGKELTRFVDTDDETSSPMARLGSDEVVLQLGSLQQRVTAVVSTASGHVVRRLGPLSPISVGGSPDGKTVYFVRNHRVWSMPSTGGEAKEIRMGDAVAVDPHGRFLVIQVIEQSRIYLIRVPVGGGVESEIPMHGWPMASTAISPNAVGVDGRLAIRLAPPGAWFWPSGILDPSTGRVDIIPLDRSVDVASPGWDDRGRIAARTVGLDAHLWRFRPIPPGIKP